MNKNLILIETLHTGSGLEIIRAAKAKEVKIHFITAEYNWFEQNCPNELAEGIQVKIVNWDNTSIKEEFIKCFNKEEEFAIFTQRDGFVESVSKIAEEYDLQFTSNKAIRLSRNKEKMRDFFQNTIISSPKYHYVNTKEELYKTLQVLSFPFIVKPANGSGSKNVLIIHNENHLSKLDKFFNNEEPAHLLFEEFKCGQVVSVESFTSNGKNNILGITNRLMGSQPYFVEYGYAFPCKYETILNEKLEEYTQFILNKLEYKFGYSHIEYILGSKDIYLVEVNARLGGGQLGNLMSYSLNFNIYELLIDALFEKKEFHLNTQNIKPSACYTVYSPKPGIVTSLLGMDTAALFPNVLQVIQGLKIGDYAKETDDMMGHVAQVIATGETPEKALVSAHSAATNIVVEVNLK